MYKVIFNNFFSYNSLSRFTVQIIGVISLSTFAIFFSRAFVGLTED